MRTARGLSLVVLTLLAAACGILFEDPFEKGDCLTKRGSGNFAKVSCSDAAAEFVVLDRFPLDDKQQGCPLAVNGTSRTYSDASTDYQYCLGELGSDSAPR